MTDAKAFKDMYAGVHPSNAPAPQINAPDATASLFSLLQDASARPSTKSPTTFTSKKEGLDTEMGSSTENGDGKVSGRVRCNDMLGMQSTSPQTEDIPEAHMWSATAVSLETDWSHVQSLLPESWRWDVEYQAGSWTFTPL